MKHRWLILIVLILLLFTLGTLMDQDEANLERSSSLDSISVSPTTKNTALVSTSSTEQLEIAEYTLDESKIDYLQTIFDLEQPPGSILEESLKKTEQDKTGYRLIYEIEEGSSVYQTTHWYLDYLQGNKIDLIREPDELRENETEVFFSIKKNGVVINYSIESEFGEEKVEIIVEVPLQEVN